MALTCPCGHDKSATHEYRSGGRDIKVAVCCRCSLGRTIPEPLADRDNADYYSSRDDFRERLADIGRWRAFAENSLSVIRRHCPPARLLDVGCNAGIFVKTALGAGYDAYGIDIASRAVDFGRKEPGLGGRLFCGGLPSADIRGGSFDIITYIHTLEHIADPAAELRRSFRVLRPGGTIHIESPDYSSLWRRLLRGRWYGLAPEEHYWQFTPRSLAGLLSGSGFRPLCVYRRRHMDHDYSFSPAGAAKAALYLAAVISGSGDNLTIVARKPYEDKNDKT